MLTIIFQLLEFPEN